ncbi:DUF6083 domain-containing protein [Nocardia cyriacigeorgica]|uniref:DUF6083 domain-containing protein n=1 Tax=Nocardia cyriacigeorgica TaxID=135487 RepID=UPI003CC7F161
MVCGASEGARERPVPLRTVACEECWDKAAQFPEREPERPDVELVADQLRTAPVVDPREGSPTFCKYCDTEALWHRTLHGRWILLEYGAYPTFQIPPGKRWRVAGDGTAVNLGGANPTDECRMRFPQGSRHRVSRIVGPAGRMSVCLASVGRSRPSTRSRLLTG